MPLVSGPPPPPWVTRFHIIKQLEIMGKARLASMGLNLLPAEFFFLFFFFLLLFSFPSSSSLAVFTVFPLFNLPASSPRGRMLSVRTSISSTAEVLWTSLLFSPPVKPRAFLAPKPLSMRARWLGAIATCS